MSLAALRGVANAASISLAIPAGQRAGQYAATWHAPPSKRARTFIGVGAAALGVGAAGWITSWTLRYTLLPRCDRTSCFVGQAAGLQSGFALAATGAGLLSYGIALRNATRADAPASSVRVLPSLGSGQSGLAVAGRF